MAAIDPTTEVAWEPGPEHVERANVTRLMRAHGIETIDELRRRSVEDVGWYWDAVVQDLGIPFQEPYTAVLDDAGGDWKWSRWFADGVVNVSVACGDRWATESPDRTAIVAEAEDGEVRVFSFAEMAAEVERCAAGLRGRGVGRGDAVGVFMPMTAEAVIAAYAVARIGAIYLPIFSGFAASAVAARLQDAGARALITADATWRRGKKGEMKSVADEAVASCPTVETVVVLDRLGTDVPMAAGRDVGWSELLAEGEGEDDSVERTGAEDTFMLAYTSGTTGKPKGSVHVHGGFLVKIASEVAYQTDVHAGDIAYWVTDMGWIMGPWLAVGSHAIGAGILMYEGAPDYPDADRIWESVASHGVSMLGISPTLVRALRQRGEELPARHDLSSLRTLGSTGEPWNPEPYRWLMDVTGGDVPIINISGGTEVGACFLSPYPVEPIKTCSLGGPSLGMDVDVFDSDGKPVRGEVGELVCKQPWPAMTRGVWGDPDRYVESYWSMYSGVWRHGDWAKIDSDGQWFLFGRSDDAINVAGKRLGPAEVESILVSHPAVAEAAVIGVPDDVKGEAVWCFCVPGAGAETDEDTVAELRAAVADALGKPFMPARLVFVEDLPRTRSAKIIRRSVRAVAIGEDPGDLASAQNPEALDAIRAALA